MTQNILEIRNLAKAFGNVEVLKDINLKIRQNEVISIIGPSGSGKSTLLRCLNLLEDADSGSIRFHKTEILNSRFDKRAYRAQVGMVFQHFNLFKNLNLLDNCLLGPVKVLKMSKAEAEKNALKNLAKVGMQAYAEAMPSQISGGQRQRIAIARALSMQPEVLLFDEPTSALDPENVQEVLQVMRDLAAESMTMVVVTHEMNFAKQVSNRICYMQDGIIEEVAEAEELFKNPKSLKTRNFLSDFTA